MSIKMQVIIKYIVAFLVAVFVWNLIILLLIHNQPIVSERSDLGIIRKPNSIHLSCREGCGIYKTDQYGFNNDNASYNARDDQTVILSIGDSITEAAQVSRKNNYSYLLEKMLNEKEQSFRVINLGGTNIDIAHQIKYADAKMNKFDPDYVLFQITWYRLAPYFTEGHLINELEDEKCLGNKLTCLFYPMARLAVNRAPFLQPIIFWSRVRTREFATKPISYQDTFNRIEQMDDDELKSRIQKIKDVYGDELVFVYITEGPRIIDGEIVLAEENRIQKFLMRFKGASRDLGMSFVDTSDSFTNLYEQRRVLPRGFNNSVIGTGHLNNDGHVAVAQSIYNFFVDNNQTNKLIGR